MNPTIIPREQVAQHFAVPARLLIAYERRGLIRTVREGDFEGYPPAEVRRLWTILSLHRDARINLAGVEAILRLNAQMDDLHRRLGRIAAQMNAVLDEIDGPEVRDDAGA